jgi:hypothetical protein
MNMPEGKSQPSFILSDLFLKLIVSFSESFRVFFPVPKKKAGLQKISVWRR